MLQAFFDWLYTNGSQTYDLVANLVSAGAWDSWMRAVLPFVSGKRLCEIGHGPGHLLVELSRQAEIELVGVDISPQMSRLAADGLRKSRLPAPLVTGSVGSLPLASQSIDCAISTFPAPALFEPAAVLEIFRILKPGGCWVCLPGVDFELNHWLGAVPFILFGGTGQRIRIDQSEWKSGVLARLDLFDVHVEFAPVRFGKAIIIVAQKPG